MAAASTALPVLLGVADVVDLEVDDEDTEQRRCVDLEALLHGERDVAAMGRHRRDVDLAHLPLEAVDHERLEVGAVIAVGGEDAAHLGLGDAVVEGDRRVELLVVDGVGVEVVLLHALDVDRERFQPVHERDAQVQTGACQRMELAEAGDDGALVLPHREERRDEIEKDHKDDEADQPGEAEETFRGPTAAGAWNSGDGNLCHRNRS